MFKFLRKNVTCRIKNEHHVPCLGFGPCGLSYNSSASFVMSHWAYDQGIRAVGPISSCSVLFSTCNANNAMIVSISLLNLDVAIKTSNS